MNQSLTRYKRFSNYFTVNRPESLNEDQLKILECLDEIFQCSSQNIPLYSLLESAMILNNHSSPLFFKLRSKKFIQWVIQEFFNSNELAYSNHLRCYISTFSHVIPFPFLKLNAISFFINIEKPDVKIEKIIQRLINNYKHLNLSKKIDDSIITITNHKEKTTKIHFELNYKNPLLETDILSLKSNLKHLLKSSDTLNQPLVTLSNDQEMFTKSFRWMMKELTSLDIPHVCINCHQHIEYSFHFSVFICRILKPTDTPLNQLLNHSDIHIEAIDTDHSNSITKEGATATVYIYTSSYISIFKARQKCSQLITSLIGPFRDINGGLLEKVNDNFKNLMTELDNQFVNSNNLKLFFYNIHSQEKQATAPISLLKIIYHLFLQQQNSNEFLKYLIEENDTTLCISVKTPHKNIEKLARHTLSTQFPSVVFTSTRYKDTIIISCGTIKTDFIDIKTLKSVVHSFYTTSLKQQPIPQTLTIACSFAFHTLDPRKAHQEEYSNILNMLFEGLTRINKKGTPDYGLAKDIEISECGCHYRFHLRESNWVNEQPLTAYDFEYSWITSLTSHMESTLTYFFFSIKNAQAVKEKILSIKSLGIHVVDKQTLDVSLHKPCPLFLTYCAHPIFSPICKSIDMDCPNWPKSEKTKYLCNGPFSIDKQERHKHLILKKNNQYWNQSAVQLNKIVLLKTFNHEIPNLLKKKELDIAAYPFCKIVMNKDMETLNHSNIKNNKYHQNYIAFNCQSAMFSHKKLRKALSLVIDRKALHCFPEHSYFKPLHSIYTSEFTQIPKEESEIYDPQKALILFKEFLSEEPNAKNIFNDQYIYTGSHNNTIFKKIANQIKRNLGLNIEIINTDSIPSHRKGTNKNMNMFSFGWVNKIDNPMYLLEIFSSSDKARNYTGWASKKLIKLIKKIRYTNCPQTQSALHLEAERILHEYVPLIPLYSFMYSSSISSNIKNIISTSNNYFDPCFAYKT